MLKISINPPTKSIHFCHSINKNWRVFMAVRSADKVMPKTKRLHYTYSVMLFTTRWGGLSTLLLRGDSGQFSFSSLLFYVFSTFQYHQSLDLMETYLQVAFKIFQVINGNIVYTTQLSFSLLKDTQMLIFQVVRHIIHCSYSSTANLGNNEASWEADIIPDTHTNKQKISCGLHHWETGPLT